MFVVLLVSDSKCSNQHWILSFSDPKRFCPSLVPRYAASNVSSHLRDWMKKNRWPFSRPWMFTRGRNTLLLRCGDVERNPGPDTATRSETRKGYERNQLVIIHVNARSLIRHFDDVSTLVLTERPHIVALSETWLDSSVADGEIHLPGYSLFRYDRNRCGGGVAIYCIENLPCSLLTCGASNSGTEFLWVTVKSACFHPSLAVGCFYRPPSAPTQSVHDVCDNIENMMLSRKYLVACGDFNIDMSDISKPFSKSFQQFITSHSLIQPICSPTRYTNSSASILDLFLTTPDVPISKSSVLSTSFSDHLPVLLQINSTIPCPQPTLITHRSFKHFNKTSFENDLSYIPWSILDIFDDPDDKVEAFNILFTNVLDDHAPVKTIRIRRKPSPWINKNIRKEMDRRDRLYRFFRRNPTSPAWEIYKAQRNRVVWLQRKAKIDYYRQLLAKKPHPSSIWNTLKLATASSISNDNWSSFNTDTTSVANILNAHFASVSSSTTSPVPSTPSSLASDSPLSLCQTSPEWCEQALASFKPRSATGLDLLPPSAIIAARSVICYPLSSIINSSIVSSHFPSPWKCASIRPLHKGGDRSIPSNYRPISLLPVPSKLLEKHVHHQLSCHLSTNNLLFPLQSGFRPYHSTQTLLLHCLDRWYKALDSKQFVGVVFLDISKAFDTVSHELLLSKLSNLGLSPSAVSWFQSYLSNRCHITRVADSFSSPGFPSSGVPQGSILGPTLFSTFINDLPTVLPPDSTALFADDTTIFIISDQISTLQASLQLCLNLANLWLIKNGLKLNTSKTKSMLIHSSKKKATTSLQLSVDGGIVEQVRCFKFLGVLVNNTLTWSDHVSMVCSKVSRSLNLLCRLSWFLPQPLLLLFLKSYILPTFDYCDIVWSGCTKNEARQLETLLNFSCRTVLRKRKDYSASAARRELGLPTLTSRRKLHTAQMVFKCLSSNTPSYLSHLFSHPPSHYCTRSSSSSQLNLPPLRTSLGQRCFSFMGASIWRSLPVHVRGVTDFKVFSTLCEQLFSY